MADRLTLSITVPASLTDINSPRGLPFTGFSEHWFASMHTSCSLVDINSYRLTRGRVKKGQEWRGGEGGGEPLWEVAKVVASRCKSIPICFKINCSNKTGNYRVSKKYDFSMKGIFCGEGKELSLFLGCFSKLIALWVKRQTHLPTHGLRKIICTCQAKNYY